MWRFARERRVMPNVPDAEEERAMKRTGILIAAAMLLLPTAALAAPGLVTTTVSCGPVPATAFPWSTAFPADRMSTSMVA
jgi:hypothetical protein